jgi:hypothetical protein
MYSVRADTSPEAALVRAVKLSIADWERLREEREIPEAVEVCGNWQKKKKSDFNKFNN